MVALQIDYLTGRVVAMSPSDAEAAEWPPHPARVFSALVAAHYECGAPEDQRAALNWLAGLPAPAVFAAAAFERDALASFVPTNDAKLPQLLPERRLRKPRTFPSATLDDPAMAQLLWEAETHPAHQQALTHLFQRVVAIGHSSSLVSLRWVDQPEDARFVPDDDGDVVLRVPYPNQLALLEHAYRLRDRLAQWPPLPTRWQRYRDVQESVAAPTATSAFGEMIVLRATNAVRFELPAAAAITRRLRDAVMSVADQPPHELLSGHTADGEKSRRHHVAYAPLPDVGHTYASGLLLGVAAVLPRGLMPAERRLVLRAVGRVRSLAFGRAGAWALEPATYPHQRRTLDPDTWTRRARRWATVTPVVLDRFPKERFGSEAEEVIARTCENIGLPRPLNVEARPHSPFTGVPMAREFISPRRAAHPPRPLVHAVVEFDRPVEGPVLLGAGRHLGYGLCRPLGRHA